MCKTTCCPTLPNQPTILHQPYTTGRRLGRSRPQPPQPQRHLRVRHRRRRRRRWPPAAPAVSGRGGQACRRAPPWRRRSAAARPALPAPAPRRLLRARLVPVFGRAVQPRGHGVAAGAARAGPARVAAVLRSGLRRRAGRNGLQADGARSGVMGDFRKEVGANFQSQIWRFFLFALCTA